MNGRVARELDFSRRLLLSAAGIVALTVPVLFGLANAPLKTQTAAGQTSVAVPQREAAAGGSMSFEVASIRLSKPGSLTPPNFPLSPDDAYVPTRPLHG